MHETKSEITVLSEGRRRLLKHLKKGAAKTFSFPPGHPTYLDNAKSFCPLEVPLGHTKQSRDELLWVPSLEDNGHFVILGASGSGKTEALKAIGRGIADDAFPVLVLDFHGDVVFPGINSCVLSSGIDSTVGINPMELDWCGNALRGFYDQRHALAEMIQRAAPKLTSRQKDVLFQAITEAYVRAGIQDHVPSTWAHRPPGFGDVLAILNQWSRDPARKTSHASVPGCIAAIRSVFDHPVFHRQTNLSVLDILRWNVRLDLSHLSDGVRFIVAETVLKKVFNTLRAQGLNPVDPVDDTGLFRLFILIDEAKILSASGGGVGSRTNILNILATEGRKFGIGLVLASQRADHFGSDVRASASTWLVMKPMANLEAENNAPNVGVSPKVLMGLAGKGEGFLRSGRPARTQRIQVGRIRMEEVNHT